MYFLVFMQISHLLEFVIPSLPSTLSTSGGCAESLSAVYHSTFLFNQKNGHEIHSVLTHTGFGLHGRVIQKISRTKYSILKMRFQDIHISSLRFLQCAASLTVHHPWTMVLSFLVVVKQRNGLCTCLLLQNEKIITMFDSWMVQLDKMHVFQ